MLWHDSQARAGTTIADCGQIAQEDRRVLNTERVLKMFFLGMGHVTEKQWGKGAYLP